MQRLVNSRVVLTGGSSGIGFGAAKLLAAEGAQLALLARSGPGLEAAAAEIRQSGATVHAIPCDVTDRPATEAAIADAAARLGGIDVFVSNAAALLYGPFEAIPPQDFERSFDVTFRGAVNAVRAALPHLESSGGVLVAVVSMASKVPIPLHTPYVAAKHALRGFLNSLRVELRARNSPVRICMLHPGFINTPFFEHSTSVVGTEPHPLRSIYRPGVVAEAIVECAVNPRREVIVGGSAALFNLAMSAARPLADLMLSTYGVWGQKTDRPAETPGMLWEPSGEGRVHGRHRGRPSVWTAVRLRNRRLLRPRDA